METFDNVVAQKRWQRCRLASVLICTTVA